MTKVITSPALSVLRFVRKKFIRLTYKKYYDIFNEFRAYTMTPVNRYVLNLTLADHFRKVDGCIVECGTWRGGMIGGIAKVLGNKRKYYLFDSFEGLPAPTGKDGKLGEFWDQNKNEPGYMNNLKTEVSFAEEAMKISGASDYKIIKGWFSSTLPGFNRKERIAVLRLDGDFYESTMQCLENLYPLVEPGGIIIIDDYYVWDGCTRAVHEYFCQNKIADRISQWNNDICYIIKKQADL